MFEVFEHTADIGLRVRAKTLPELFTDAASGLLTLIVDNLDAVQPKEQRFLRLESESVDLLLFDWLEHLLFLFDADHWIAKEWSLAVDEKELRATLHGESLDLTRHVMAHEVKAITYHGLKVWQENHEWFAEVIVDI
jgi:SHS2 domain-containing protein